MERPAVQKMLEFVRNGKINCIIIKDFSRFSRSALDSGYFIEQVFPLYGVRFISISDNFDSNDYKGDTGGIDVAFKFLMHEYYSADLSKKVKSAKRLQMKRGENIVAKAIFGYYKADNGKWEPDEPIAAVVREIYACVLDGMSPAQIRDKLFAEQIPTPKEHLEIIRGKDITPSCLWEARAVTKILTNEQYKGTYISGKQESKAIGSHSKDWVDKSGWIVIPNSHTPIVSEEVFAQVQELMKRFLTSESAPKTSVQTDNLQRKQKPLMERGEKIAAVPIYGYSKNEDGSWSVDEIAAAVVRKIYDLALQGVHEAQIAANLKNEGYTSPREYVKLKKGQKITPTCAWRTKGIRDILRNIQYTGAYVSGKYLTKCDGTKQKFHTHESDWIILPDKHPAIIIKSDFDAVAELMANRGKRKFSQIDYLLRGNIVKCGCCGHALSYDKLSDPVYRCYHTAADPNAECRKLKIIAAELDDVVLAIIRKKAEVVLSCSDLSKLQGKSVDEYKITDCEKSIFQNTEERQGQYERFILGEITRDEYVKLKNESNVQLERLTQQLAAMKSEMEYVRIGAYSIAAAKKAVDESATPRELVEALIDSVRVYPGKRIDINWKIADFVASE
jgi:DNA invertase Pin-like site-specific DNA recombinase